MLKQSVHRHVFTFVVGVTFLAFSGWVSADPPSRVGRLGYMTGGVSFSPAGENDWVQASMNRPLTTGDRLRRSRVHGLKSSWAERWFAWVPIPACQYSIWTTASCNCN